MFCRQGVVSDLVTSRGVSHRSMVMRTITTTRVCENYKKIYRFDRFYFSAACVCVCVTVCVSV